MSDKRMQTRVLPWGVGAFAVLFGLMTLFTGGAVVFDVGTARSDHGAYVPFVVQFNFVSGFAYIAAGVGLALRQRWGPALATALAAGIALTGIAFGVYALGGGPYETETAIAMSVRFTIWLGISAVAWMTRRSVEP